jgi:hypothetical protein
MKRALITLALCAALVTIAVPAVAASAGSGSVAVAAKKKCKGKKGKKAGVAKKGKCKKGGSDIARATALFAGSSFTASGCTSTANCNRSYTYTLGFCRDTKYAARFELNDGITGNTFVDRFAGTWRFTAANAKTGTGTLAYTIDQWSSDAGTAQPARDQTAPVQAKSATSFVIDGTEYTRSAGGAGC